ncbi:flagellar basal body P-ring formation chaperone FlgA [Gemmatimonas sp.]|jgi:flagella basal body P-ring formation protein FlgA|uniref:flagellar basal body P-ring formation chaperone FlgA n=1 Tax=Gemmatimonas sp. TaxID=1962908 RepID=UPI0037BF6369
MTLVFMRLAISTCLLASAVSGSVSVLGAQERTVTVSVAARALVRGDTLQASDIATMDTTIVWRWNSVAPDTTRALPGWVTRRNIALGEVLRAPAVMPPPAITSGTRVTAIWQDGPLRVVVTGIATNTAAIGAPVGVRIDPTRRLDGIAAGPNTVRLR